MFLHGLFVLGVATLVLCKPILNQPEPETDSRPLKASEYQDNEIAGYSEKLELTDACVWAILSCCNPGSEKLNIQCFKTLGCSGPFWGRNPCDFESGQAAINSAEKYFGVSSTAVPASQYDYEEDSETKFDDALFPKMQKS